MKSLSYGAIAMLCIAGSVTACGLGEPVITNELPVEGVVSSARTEGVDEDNQPIFVHIKLDGSDVEYYCWVKQAWDCADVEPGSYVTMRAAHYEWGGSVHDNYVMSLDIR